MEDRNFTGDDTREFSAPPEPERVDDNELIGELVDALKGAIDTIHCWHGDVAWDIYTKYAPEMTRIHAAIAKAEQR